MIIIRMARCKLLILALIIALALACWKLPKITKAGQENEFCSSLDCRKESLRLWNNVKKNGNECYDFHEYACGNFIHMFKEAGFRTVSQLSLLERKIKFNLLNDLAIPVHTNDSCITKVLKNFFNKCSSGTVGNTKSILKFIKKIGGWPLVDGNWGNSGDHRFYKIIRHLKSNNLDVKLPFKVEKIQLPWHRKIEIRPVESLLNTGLNEKYVFEANFDLISQTATLLGGIPKIINPQLRQMKELEALIHTDSISYSFGDANEYSINNLTRKFREIKWYLLFDTLFEHEQSISEFNKIIVYDTIRLKRISALLMKYEKTFVNYLVWNIVAPWTSNIVKESEQDFAYKDKEANIRSHACLSILSDTIPLNAFYAQKYVGNAKFEVESMFDIIQERALKYLESFDKKNEKVSSALEKLKNLKTVIGSHEFMLQNGINSYYNKTLYETQTSFEIYIDIKRRDKQIISTLPQKTRSTINSVYDIKVAHTDVGYQKQYHVIYIPGGVLQPPYYDPRRPVSLNFGGIGFVIGHEVVHSFGFRDDTIVKCLQHQFSHFNIKQINETVDGIGTVEENYADSLGIRLAYDAFRLWKKNNKTELPLAHFPTYKPEQMFWLSAANLWCEFEDDEFLKKSLKDAHSPGETRINVGFSSVEEFSNDFNCLRYKDES